MRRRVYHGAPDGRTVPYVPPSALLLAVRALVAKVLENCGVRPGCSTGIDDRLTRGYGRLDANGFWEFPL